MPQRRVILEELEHRVRVWAIDLDLQVENVQPLLTLTSHTSYMWGRSDRLFQL